MAKQVTDRVRRMSRFAPLWAVLAGLSVFALSAVAADQVVKQTKSGEDLIYSRGLHFQTEGEVVPLAEDGVHDPTDEAIKVLQEPSEAMQGFPRDSQGIVDWVKVLDSGLINPRASLNGDMEMFPVDFNVILKNTGSMPYVRFPHRPHTIWLTCRNCHPKIFIPQAGGNPITMSAIIQGKYCGVCHGKVAFPPTKNCGRCHSVPRKTALLR